jgi:hypothetical protein
MKGVQFGQYNQRASIAHHRFITSHSASSSCTIS